MLNTLKKHSTALILSAVVVASFGLVVNAAHASDTCTLNVMAKNAKVKSVYLSNGEKMSIKSLSKFAGVCTIKTTIMTDSQVNAMKIVELKAKLAKLQAK